MASLNFGLAPPPRTVDGLMAVPIDMQRVEATLRFDGAAQSGTGDATVDFTVGPNPGCPFFDLRQTIEAAWLDGSPIAVNRLRHHDFGGGADAGLRIVESILTAGSVHRLRVAYPLGLPQASNAGSYLPGLSWSAGPRLSFNFGFTDLGAGRYLEAWVPANLIFDQFELVLDLQVANTAVAHTLITNGAITLIGANHWRVAFPDRFTALSPLVEVRATDSLAGSTGSVGLPVSGSTVSIEAWKPAGSAVDLPAQIAAIRSYLSANETAIGPYLHGHRFVAFLRGGGMEYEGAATSGVGALQHEAFHSWWARGVKPASQADGWWDEAWTAFQIDTPPRAVPLDFTSPPVTLCSRNPWVRVTPSAAYTAGDRLFEGLAAITGLANLNQYFREFYGSWSGGQPVRTQDLEEGLVARSGDPRVVDAFHRFVYGLEDPRPAPDLWIRDAPADPGADLWTGAFWDSPDLWVRNRDDGGLIHQPPEYGQDNWFHARVRNRGSGTASHFVVTFQVKEYVGTQFEYPRDFLPPIAASAGFELAPGGAMVLKARWPKALVPRPGTHGCLLAAVLARGDHPSAARRVWEHNNLAQKNLVIVDLRPSRSHLLPFIAANLLEGPSRRYTLELRRVSGAASGNAIDVELLHPTGLPFRLAGLAVTAPAVVPDASLRGRESTDCGRPISETGDADTGGVSRADPSVRVETVFAKAVVLRFAPAAVAEIPILLRPREQLAGAIRFRVGAGAAVGQVGRFELVQRDSRTRVLLGGFAVEMRII